MSAGKDLGKARGGLLPTRQDIEALINAEHRDPFSVLGPHADGLGGYYIRAFLPQALSVNVVDRETGDVLGPLSCPDVPGLSVALAST